VAEVNLTPSLVISDLRNGYVDLVNWVIEEGQPTAPRGQQTRELLGARVVLTNPVDAIPIGVNRNTNMKIGAAEAAQSWSGVSDAAMLNAVSNGNFKAFMNGNVLRGAYGPRVAPQMANIAKRLYRDPDSRQALSLVWKPDDLALEDTKDLPCTVALQYMIRDGKLHAFTTMRSNDVWLGVAYDFWMFTRIQLTLAWCLGVEVGNYYHSAASFHIYDRNIEAAGGLRKTEDTLEQANPPLGFTNSAQDGVRPSGEDEVVDRVWKSQVWAAEAVTGQADYMYTGTPGDNVQWYIDTLEPYRTENGVLCTTCSYVRPPLEAVTAEATMVNGILVGLCSRCRLEPGAGRFR
jgi:thymidylate synthase